MTRSELQLIAERAKFELRRLWAALDRLEAEELSRYEPNEKLAKAVQRVESAAPEWPANELLRD